MDPRRPLALTAALLALCLFASSSHAAGGIAMRWDRCYGDGGVSNKDFACNTNSGSEKLVLSFKVDADIPGVTGFDVQLMEMGSTVNGIPAWWQFKNAGSCRSASLTSGVLLDPAAVSCADPFAEGGATMVAGVGSYFFTTGGTVRISIAAAVPSDAASTLHAGQEYFASSLIIDHKRTVGTNSCSGCVTPICLIMQQVRLSNGTDYLATLQEPFAPNSATVGWQGGSPNIAKIDPTTGGPSPLWYLQGCSLPTPARNATWGMIKSLYR